MKIKVAFLGTSVLSIANILFAASPMEGTGVSEDHKLLVGWASRDITPEKPVVDRTVELIDEMWDNENR